MLTKWCDMKEQMLKDLIDAMRLAGRIPNEMPELPKGMTPSYIHIIDIIHSYCEDGKEIRLSDIAKEMNTALPGITRSIKAMENINVVKKKKNNQDLRDVNLFLTKKGEKYYEIYVNKFYKKLSENLKALESIDIKKTIEVIKSLSIAIDDVRINFGMNIDGGE